MTQGGYISTPDPSLHPEFESEQAYIEYAYRCLEAMKSSAELLRDTVIRESGGGTHQARFQRDVIVQSALQRLDQLDIGTASLCFGRIDQDSGERFYIGRRAVAGPDQEAVVVDWRVPVAESFYRATGRHRMGLELRRHFACEGARLVSIEDERFSDDEQELGLAGTGALMSALEATRTGHMRDIVATVQREQDEIIRADVEGVLAVQGGPGTGKTAVALHRAAYLLFTHRERLDRDGVLVVGPNRLFLRYIDRVLPALGESGVVLTTPDGLFSGARVNATDTPGAARIKGDPRMASVIAKAAELRQGAVNKELTLYFDEQTLRLTPSMATSIVRSIKRSGGTHNSRRTNAKDILARRFYTQYRKAMSKGPTGARASVQPVSRAEMLKELESDLEFNEMLDLVWPVLPAERLVADLLSDRAFLHSAGKGIFTPKELDAILRPAGPEEIRWTSNDIALLDEALTIVGSASGSPVDLDEPQPDKKDREEEEDEEQTHRNYGHIIVDEVQDLSPMQLRMLQRRSRNGSMTVVGDIAQATGTMAPDGWEEVLEYLPSWKGQKVAELSINYRTPKEIMEYASRLLHSVAPHLQPSRSIRFTGGSPRVVSVGPEQMTEAVSRAALRETDETTPGNVAVIAVEGEIESYASAMTEAGVPFADARTAGLGSALTLVPMNSAKGLEFDSVIVVEPDSIVSSSPQGMRALYVALTRATRRLTVIHSRPLPAALGTGV